MLQGHFPLGDGRGLSGRCDLTSADWEIDSGLASESISERAQTVNKFSLGLVAWAYCQQPHCGPVVLFLKGWICSHYLSL